MRQELYINSTIIPLKEDVPVPVTYAIADIREPDKRKSSISKTITIPGTKEVNKLFGHIYDIGIDSAFDPNKKTSAVLYVDSIPVLTGALQLSKINRLDKEEIEYECILISALADIITTWGDTLLETLDLSEYSHPTYFKSIQWDSLDTALAVPGGTQPFALGTGYVYPLMDTGGYFSEPYASPPVIHAADQFPAVYVKTYLDKAFAAAGFRYSSAFLNSTLFKSLIIPFQNTEARRPKRTLTIELTMNFLNADIHNTYTVVVFATWVNKGGSTNNVQLGSCSVPAGGSFNYHSVGNIQYDEGNVLTITFTGGSGFVGVASGANWTGTYANDDIHYFDGSFDVFTSSLYGASTVPAVVPFDTINSDPDGAFDTSGHSHTSPYYKLQAYTPKNIKIRDFFKSLITMFNLMVMPDKDDAALLYMEPYASFYDKTKTVNWSAKWATDKPVVITPLPLVDGKKITFTYKTGERDCWNDKYFSTWQEVYGQRIITIDNDFLKDEQKYELPYAPSPLTWGKGDVIFTSNAKDLPTIPVQKPNAYSGALRIMYYGGKIPGSFNYGGYADMSAAASNTVPQDYYGYAGHFDNPWTPTLDLNWDVCNELYYGTASDIGVNYTDNNLYNAYWKQYIDEATDKNCKLIEAWFYLTPADIANFDFRGYVFFDKYLCRVNQIIDYNPTSEGLTKVELLNIRDGVPFTPSTSTKARPHVPGGVFKESTTYKTTISQADIANLHSAPIQLIDPYGAGTVIQVISMVSTINNSTTPYSGSTTLGVAYAGYTASPVITDGNILTQTSGSSIGCSTCSGGQAAYENTGIVAFVETGNPEAGDGDLTISLTYKIIDIS
jgi:hypothetical protein